MKDTMNLRLRQLATFLSPAAASNENSVLKAALLNAAVSVLVAFFQVIFGLFFYYLCGLSHPVMIGYFLSFPMALATIAVFGRTASLRASINFLIGVSLFSIVYVACFAGGLQCPVLLWLTAVPSVGGNLLRGRDKIFWGSATCIIFATFFVADRCGLTFTNVIPPAIYDYYLFMTLVSVMLGSLSCILLFDRDIQTLVENSIDAEKRLRTLLRTVLHDLSNPLSLIGGSVYILMSRTPSAEKNNKWWLSLTEGISRMEEILIKIRDLEKIKAKKVILDMDSVSVHASITAALNNLQDRLKEKNLQIDYDEASAMGITVLADAVTLVHQVITNLLTNAIKFSPIEGRIYLNVTKHKGYFGIVVGDEGVGIPEATVQTFRRSGELLSTQGTAGEKGSGFGLTIVKSFVEMYGGLLELESRNIEQHPESHGTRVIVYLRPGRTEEKPLVRKAAA